MSHCNEMNRTGRLAAMLLCLGLLAATAAPPARAESIWDRRNPRAAFLYSDNLAADVGDSLTVTIAEQSAFKKDDERQMEKTTASAGSAEIDAKLTGLTIPAGTLVQQSSRTFEGSNEFDSSRRLTDSITATVIDVLPNGNLVIAGRSERRIEQEDVVTIVTGIVKPEDVSGANTVLSSRVAHLRVHYETTGESDAYMRQGWLNWILDLIWPF